MKRSASKPGLTFNKLIRPFFGVSVPEDDVICHVKDKGSVMKSKACTCWFELVSNQNGIDTPHYGFIRIRYQHSLRLYIVFQHYFSSMILAI